MLKTLAVYSLFFFFFFTMLGARFEGDLILSFLGDNVYFSLIEISRLFYGDITYAPWTDLLSCFYLGSDFLGIKGVCNLSISVSIFCETPRDS